MKSLLALVAVASLAAGNLHVSKGDRHTDGECGDGGPGAICVDDADCEPALQCGEAGICASPEHDETETPNAGCTADADCAAGEICAADGGCVVPTCDQIAGEALCVERIDCEPVYAGVDCSCGAECTCQPGDVGCVCESFEFFRCELAE